MNPDAAPDPFTRRPLAFSALLIVAAGAVEVLLKATADLLSLDLSVITIGIVSGSVLSALGAVLISRLGLWRQLGLSARPRQPEALLWFLPFAITGLLPLTQGGAITAAKAAAAIAFGVLIAFWKLMVLGLVLHAWLPRGARPAAAAAALFWAGMHLGFGILTGGTVAPTVVLALSYVFLGFAFAAVRLRTGLLWPIVACYALLLAAAVATMTTEASNLATTVADQAPLLVISILLTGYGLLAWPRRPRPASQDDLQPVPCGSGHDRPTRAPLTEAQR